MSEAVCSDQAKGVRAEREVSRLWTKFLILFDQGIASAANFLTTLIIGNACGEETLGLYALGFSVVLLSNATHSALVGTPFTVIFHNIAKSERKDRAGSFLINLLLVTGLLVMLQGVGLLTYGWFAKETYFQVLMIVLVISPFPIVRASIRQFLLARYAAVQVLVFDSFVILLQVSLLSWLAISQQLTAVYALWILGAACLVPSVLFFVLQRREFSFDSTRISKDLRRDWRFGKWLVGEQVLAVVSMFGAPWLLAALMDESAVGIFAACFSITGLANPILLGLGNYLLPRFSENYSHLAINRANQMTYRYLAGITLVMLVFAAFCVIFDDSLLAFFYRGDAFAGFGLVLSLLAVRSLVGSVGLVLNIALLAMQRPRVGLLASAVAIVVLFVGAWILIPMYGVLGGAIAWLLACTVETTLILIGFQWSAVELESTPG